MESLNISVRGAQVYVCRRTDKMYVDGKVHFSCWTVCTLLVIFLLKSDKIVFVLKCSKVTYPCFGYYIDVDIFNNGRTLDGIASVISEHKRVLSWHKHSLFYFSIPAVCFSCKRPFSGSPFKLGVNQHKYTLPICIMMGWCVVT
jgi:hypothetical protein